MEVIPIFFPRLPSSLKSVATCLAPVAPRGCPNAYIWGQRHASGVDGYGSRQNVGVEISRLDRKDYVLKKRTIAPPLGLTLSKNQR